MSDTGTSALLFVVNLTLVVIVVLGGFLVPRYLAWYRYPKMGRLGQAILTVACLLAFALIGRAAMTILHRLLKGY